MRNGRTDEIDFRVSDIEGTNCYLDDSAIDAVQNRIDEACTYPIRLFGSGNYHYLTYFFLKEVCEDFYLLILDNHPDMQLPAFGDIISCGSWARKSIETLDHLKGVYILGADDNHVKEEEPFPLGTFIIEDISKLPRDLPLYISIDKDVLSPVYAVTDWDQGRMSLDEMAKQLAGLRGLDIIAADICGDSKKEPLGSLSKINSDTNKKLIAALKELMSSSC